MRIDGHGVSIDVPHGWDARIFCREGAAPVLHAATFALKESDGDFGAAATGRMRGDDVFIAVLEYRADAVLLPGAGLFDAHRPLGLRASELGSNQLQVTRAGQLGCQRFYTEAGRPFCLYAVIQPLRRGPDELIAELSGVVATLRLDATAAA
jgi:hypothetical protein